VRITVIAVGRPSRLFGGIVAEYERRAARYWNLESVEVRAESATGGKPAAMVRAAEGARLLARVPDGAEVVALTRAGRSWSSRDLAEYLEGLAVSGRPGVAFLIGGAYGLDDAVLQRARQRLALSSFTLPHDLARLVLVEQLHRAGTILRGEPYHKAME